MTRAIVAGVGMIPFKKPDAANVYVAMGSEAARRALSEETITGLVRVEISERQAAARQYADAGQDERASRLAAEARALSATLRGREDLDPPR